jgi:hypothetical protein
MEHESAFCEPAESDPHTDIVFILSSILVLSFHLCLNISSGFFLLGSLTEICMLISLHLKVSQVLSGSVMSYHDLYQGLQIKDLWPHSPFLIYSLVAACCYKWRRFIEYLWQLITTATNVLSQTGSSQQFPSTNLLVPYLQHLLT